MIKSFNCKHTERLYKGHIGKKFSSIALQARRKLRMIDASETIEDLRVPPSNHLEKLSGDRKGQHSIRINKQWRICFKWTNGMATNVEIVDYH